MHASKLERWLGAETVNHVSSLMKGWYGPPIALAGVPGSVFVHGDGNFSGKLRAGGFISAIDRFHSIGSRLRRGIRKVITNRGSFLGTGFASISQMIASETAGKAQRLYFTKTGNTGTVGATHSLWGQGTLPVAGSAGGAAPGGTAFTSSSTGAMPFNNAGGSDTLHHKYLEAFVNVAPNTLILYDRLFGVAKTMSSAATEAVTGVPTRYTSTTPGAADSAEGNFLLVETRATIPAVAHNWTVCLYTNQAGTTGQTVPSIVGNSASTTTRLDMPLNQWFAPLASGDTGIKALTQMQCSTASVNTGNIDFAIGHAIAFLPCFIANMVCMNDGLYTAMNLTRVFDNACLALLEASKAATTATTYSGSVGLLAG